MKKGLSQHLLRICSLSIPVNLAVWLTVSCQPYQPQMTYLWTSGTWLYVLSSTSNSPKPLTRALARLLSACQARDHPAPSALCPAHGFLTPLAPKRQKDILKSQVKEKPTDQLYKQDRDFPYLGARSLISVANERTREVLHTSPTPNRVTAEMRGWKSPVLEDVTTQKNSDEL